MKEKSLLPFAQREAGSAVWRLTYMLITIIRIRKSLVYRRLEAGWYDISRREIVSVAVV